ncbi:MAG: hypothetical protein JNL67_12745 [Planctomycetaceae bacterium]|nr:hypothetical protein [Planctomycetaceae bacterium]
MNRLLERLISKDFFTGKSNLKFESGWDTQGRAPPLVASQDVGSLD